MQLVMRFMKSVFSMKAPWPLWVALLMVLNMIGPLFFIHTMEAQAVLASTLAGAFLMMLIFSGYGFVRLLGLGHIFWVPLVIWLGLRIPELSLDTPFTIWLVSVVGFNCLSLVMDVLDVSLYLLGDRKPLVSQNH
ncbi:MAG: hypothetical protein F3745_02745 [Nitrospinae bacterium]|nr:hypothetical protein [Nitrospinota bacterium]